MGQSFIGHHAGDYTDTWNEFVEKTQVVLVRFFLENQDRGLGFVEHIFDFFRSITGIDRHHDRADACQCKISVRPLRVARHPDRHLIAFADAQAEKAAGDEIRRLLELIVGNFAVVKDRGDLVAIALSRLVQRDANGFPRPLIVPHVFLKLILLPPFEHAVSNHDGTCNRSTPHSTLGPSHLMTLSALTSTFGGIVRPICFAVFRLMTNSNFSGCSTGNSCGFVPFRILSTNVAARLNKSERSVPYATRPPASTNSFK